MAFRRPISAVTPLLRRTSEGLFARIPNAKLLWKVGGFMTTLGIATGAFGTHALKNRVTDAGKLHSWETASHYAIFNGIALLALSLHPRFSVHRFAGPAICIGTLLFSGSIWTVTLDQAKRFRWLWPVPPFGGTLMILGYFSLLF